MKTPKYLSIMSLAVIGALYGSSPALADSILGPDLATFAVLGGSTVTNTGPTTITGNVGDWLNPTAANAVTGFPPGQVSGTIYQHPAAPTTTQALAQGQLTTAINALTGMGPGTPETSLGGLTLGPGVYSSPSSTMDLTGTLTLDGGGNANALWVFLVGSSLTTASSSVVNVFNTGAGAGLFWVMGASATLGSNSTFEGNILASTSITMGDGVTIGCGRALAHTGDVTMINDTIGIGCSGILTGSNGLSGGGTITNGVITSLPFAPVPEPEIYAMLLAGLGLIGFSARRRNNA